MKITASKFPFIQPNFQVSNEFIGPMSPIFNDIIQNFAETLAVVSQLTLGVKIIVQVNIFQFLP